MNVSHRRAFLALAVLLSAPLLLHVFQPNWQLGGFGLLLGTIGITLSPLILYGCLVYTVKSLWR